MKKLSLFPLACGLLCCTVGFTAQAQEKSPAKKALSDQKLLKDATALKAPLKDIPSAAQKAERVGEVYRLWLSINPTDDNDEFYLMQPPKEVLDAVFSGGPRRSGNAPGFECYGFLKINDVVCWRSSPDVASNHIVRVLPLLLPARENNPQQKGPDPLTFDPRRQGYSVNRDLNTLNNNPSVREQVYEVTYNKATPASGQLRLELKLTDRDVLPPAWAPIKGYVDTTDDVFGDFKPTIDIAKLGDGDGHYYWFWKGSGNQGEVVGSQLYLHIEHVRGVFEPIRTETAVPRPKIDEKVTTKKFPRGKPGPGPIIKSQVKGRVKNKL